MSLQKGFFMTESFNPSPFWDNTIVNLSGAQKFEEDTVFPVGRYRVDVQAGATYTNGYSGYSAQIIQDVVVEEPFIIRAYCGSRGTQSSGGINPYSGEYKVNSYTNASNVPSINHIFGNSGSPGLNPNAKWVQFCASGNCLGNGVLSVQGAAYQAPGAGSCLHFLPNGGTFGIDYLKAFHVTAAPNHSGGSGSAYGGAGSGRANNSASSGLVIGKSYSLNAGSTPYGTGGAGVYSGASDRLPGNNGTGIGFGYGGGMSGGDAKGAGAWFDGTIWHDSRTVASAADQDGHIIVTYLGTIN